MIASVFLTSSCGVSDGSRLRFGQGPEHLGDAFGGRTDDGPSAGHRFEQHVGHSFPPRRQDHQVAGQQNLRHGRLPAGEMDPLRDAAFGGQSPQAGRLRTVADQQQIVIRASS